MNRYFGQLKNFIEQIFDLENPQFATALKLLFPVIIKGEETLLVKRGMLNFKILILGRKIKILLQNINGIKTTRSRKARISPAIMR